METVENSMKITPIVLPPLNDVSNAVSISVRSRPPPLVISKNERRLDIYETPSVDLEELENSIIRNIDASVASRMFDYKKTHAIATKSAIEMHNQWRSVYIQQNGNLPRIKKTKDGLEVDINVDGSLLNPEFLEFNYNMAIFVATCIMFYPCKTIEEISSIIHRKWLMMSPWAKGSTLDVPYSSLPEIEKEKDRDIFRIVIGIFYYK
jgi:hypothetical protein